MSTPSASTTDSPTSAMPNRLAEVLDIPNHVLFTFSFAFEDKYGKQRPTVRAHLTQVAHDMGVKFVPGGGYSDIGNLLDCDKDGNWVEGRDFHIRAKNTGLDQTGRVLLADLPCSKEPSGYRQQVPFKLDDLLGLSSFWHARYKERYYKLGFRNRRTLVLCYDGTSNHFSDENTNVVKFVELLQKDEPQRQMVYYQTGVGTYVSPGYSGILTKNIAAKVDEGLAWYLYQHVIDGYKYLMDTYQAGDRIWIFGFSRGAFTARALAGMLHCVGLLPRHNVEHVPFAFQIYEAHDVHASASSKGKSYGALGGSTSASKVNAADYKRTFCIPVNIHFVGVWDTVASVGSLRPKTLPLIEYNPSIRIFRHALALDEKRTSFAPSLWDHTQTQDYQNVREVWFRGEHCDVGGGAAYKNLKGEEKYKFSALSNIALRWMVHQCLEANASITFDKAAIANYCDCNVLDGKSFVPKDKPEKHANAGNPPTESAALDKIDIERKLCGTVTTFSPWKILEFLPVSRLIQTKKGSERTHVPNVFGSRTVYSRMFSKENVFIHPSVVNYLVTSKDYTPKTSWKGFADGVLPKVEGPPAEAPWTEEAIKALDINWKKKQSWTEWFTSFWSKSKKRT